MDSMQYQYELLFGGAYSIKDYYMESGNPRQMRGASELLNECTEDVKRLLRDKDITVEENDANIFIGGATLSARVPSGKGKELAKKAELIFRGKCRTANAAFVAVPYNSDYSEAKSHALDAYERRKSAKFTSWEFQNAKVNSLLKQSEDKPVCEFKLVKPNDSEVPSRCPRCRMRDPHYHFSHRNGEEGYLCTSCAKREKKSGERKYDMRKKICEERFHWSYEINTMSNIADSDGCVALLYADINNLGGAKYRKTSFDDDKNFHDGVQGTVNNAVREGLERAMEAGNYRYSDNKLTSRFEIVALGGDDICLLLPGNVALLTAKTIVEEFDKNPYKLTISVAACVANDTTPLAYMEGIVSSALEKAKTIAREKEQSVVNMSYFERPSGLFPMTTTDIKDFANLLSRTRRSTAVTALRNVSEARRELSFDEEFALFFNYYMSHDSENRSILRKIQDNYIGENPWPDFVTWRNQKLGKGGRTL